MRNKKAIFLVFFFGLLLAGCSSGTTSEKIDEANSHITIIGGEEKEKDQEENADQKKNSEPQRDIMKLSLKERRELFQEYSLKLAGNGWEEFILCNPDGTVTVFGFQSEETNEWTDIVEVAVSTNYAMGLKSDGTVVVSELFDYDNEVNYREAETWTDIKHIAANQFFAVGLKEDGTVIWSDHERLEHITQPEQMAEWKDIVQIVSCTGTVFGLKSDGTVVFNHYNEETTDINGADFNALYAPVETWTDVSFLTMGEGSLAALTNEGKVLTIDIEVNTEDGGTDPAEWENVVGIAAMSNLLVGLLEDGTLVATDELHDVCTSYENVAGLYGDQNGGVVAITYDGRLIGEECFCDRPDLNREELQVESFVQYQGILGIDAEGKLVFYRGSGSSKELLGEVVGAKDVLYGAGNYMVLYEDGHVEAFSPVKDAEREAAAKEVETWTDIEKLVCGSGRSGMGAIGDMIAGIDSSGRAHFIDSYVNESPVVRYEGPTKDMTAWYDVAIELKPEGVVYTYDIQGAKGTYKHPDVSQWKNIEKIFQEGNTLFGIDSEGNTHCAPLYFGSQNRSSVDLAAAMEVLKNVEDLCVSGGTVVAVDKAGKVMVSGGGDNTMSHLVNEWKDETIKEVKTLSNGNVIALTEDGRLLETVVTGLIYE